MEFLKELLLIEARKPGILIERLTSPHVLSRSDITAILNVIKKEFGLDRDTNSDIGLCLLSQVVFSIAAASGADEKELGDYITGISDDESGSTFNDLGKMIEWFNRTPMKLKDKWVQFKLNAHPIKNSEEMKDELRSGQPVICAVPSGGKIDNLLYTMAEIVADEGFGNWLGRDISEADKKMVKDELSKGLISKASVKFARDTSHNYAFHASLCFGFEDGDKAFLFREPRPKYAIKGYYKIVQELFVPANIGKGKLIGGMFYVEVMDMKEIERPLDAPGRMHS